MATSVQQQARALGDPTRYRIFEHLADAGTPVGVAELTDLLGLNHNAIRQHLAKLVDAELAVEATAPPRGRGRPRLEYVVDPNAESRWSVTGPYERLAVLLAEVTRSGEHPTEVGRRAGRRQPLPLGAADPADPVGAIAQEMARQGFAPRVRRDGDVVEVVLESCPFASAVLTDPDTVCGLHLGIARGVAETVGGVTVEQLVPRDPRRAHCRLRCRVEPR